MTSLALHVRDALAPAASCPPLWDFVASTRLRAIVSGTSKDPNAKITVLLVDDDGRAVLVAKLPTTAAAERAVAREVSVLTELETLELGAIAPTIPRVVDIVEYHGRRAVVMTALPGRPLSALYTGRRHTRDPRAVEADFDAAAGWIETLHDATARDGVVAAPDVSQQIRERFARTPLLELDLQRLATIETRLCASRAPSTVVHGDFWFGNLLLEGNRMSGVVDWEAAATSGDPVRDLARFANVYALYRQGPSREWGSALAQAIDGDGWFPQLYRRFLEQGLARLGVDRALWRDVALVGVAEVAALTDHETFATHHLELFRRLAAEARA